MKNSQLNGSNHGVTGAIWGKSRNRARELQGAIAALQEEIHLRREATSKLAAYASLGRQLNSAIDRHEAARIIVATADKLLGWDACFLILYREKDDRILPILGMDVVEGRRTNVSQDLIEEKPGPMFRRVLREGGQIILRQTRTRSLNHLTAFGDKSARSKSLLFVPIRHGEVAVGILSIQSYRANAYDQDSLDTLQSLADHCGSALHRISTEEELRKTVRELERVMEALRGSEQRFRAMFVGAAVGICVTDARGAFIESNAAYRQITGYSGEELRATNFLALTHPQDRPLNRNLIKQMFAGKTPGFDIEKRYIRKDRTIVWVQNSVSLLRDPEGRPAEIIALTQDITERRKAERLVLEQNRLVELVAQGAALRDVLDEIVGFVEQYAPGTLGSILLLEPETRRLRHGSAPSLPAAYNRAVDGLEIGPCAGSCGISAYLGKPVIVSDIASDPLWKCYSAMAARYNLRACWSNPILSVHGEVLGTFALYYREPRRPGEQEKRLVQIATHVTGMAIERQRSDKVLRDFHRRVVQAQETERRRVSRELHDSVSQLLASIRFRIQSMIESPIDDPILRNREKVQLKLLIDHAMREVRRISRNLRPSELDDLGLESAIGNMAREFDQRTHIGLTIHFSNLPKRFPPEIELAVYRIIQESLRNIEQHSGATRAEVRLTRTRKCLLLKIIDNGKGGFDPSARSRKRADSGIGLANIRERATMVGGTFNLESNHLTGTRIAVRIPMDALVKSSRTIE